MDVNERCLECLRVALLKIWEWMEMNETLSEMAHFIASEGPWNAPSLLRALMLCRGRTEPSHWSKNGTLDRWEATMDFEFLAAIVPV
jgi:hypothetical protein